MTSKSARKRIKAYREWVLDDIKSAQKTTTKLPGLWRVVKTTRRRLTKHLEFARDSH